MTAEVVAILLVLGVPDLLTVFAKAMERLEACLLGPQGSPVDGAGPRDEVDVAAAAPAHRELDGAEQQLRHHPHRDQPDDHLGHGQDPGGVGGGNDFPGDPDYNPANPGQGGTPPGQGKKP